MARHEDYLRLWHERYSDTRELTDVLRRLLSGSKEASTVQRWIELHAHPGIGRDGVPDALEELERLAALLQLPFGPSPWQAASAEDRAEHTARVAALARDLASALEKQPGPAWPELPALLDPDNRPRLCLRGLAEQSVPGLLRNLATHAEEQARPRIPDARPTTGPVAARVFARNIVPYFREWFDCEPPPSLIAAVTEIRFPGTRASAEQARDWLRDRNR